MYYVPDIYKIVSLLRIDWTVSSKVDFLRENTITGVAEILKILIILILKVI